VALRPAAVSGGGGAAMVSGDDANVYRWCYHQSVAELQESDDATIRNWNATGGAPARSFTMLQFFCDIFFFCYEHIRRVFFSFLNEPFFSSMM
jgi:hypothetical protein